MMAEEFYYRTLLNFDLTSNAMKFTLTLKNKCTQERFLFVVEISY